MKKSALLFLFLFPGLLLAQTEKLTMDDLLGAGGNYGRRGAEGSQTPDGKYTVILKDGQIALKPSDGSPEIVLTSTPDAKGELDLSSDGSHIAYVSHGQVWVVSTSGGDPVELTNDAAGPGDPRGATDHHPQWSPSGNWILYESGRKGFNELYVVREDGKVSNLLAATEIYRGKDVIANTTTDRGDAVAADRFDPRPAWSPDGTRISYTERSREFLF